MSQKVEVVLGMRLSEEMKSEWTTLVNFALAIDAAKNGGYADLLSKKVNVGADSIKRKLEAIQYQRALGFDAEAIIATGQEKVLGAFVRSKRVKSYGDSVVMKWSVPGSLRELIQQDERRIKELLGIYTSEEFFDWLHSVFIDLTDDDIKASAGETIEEK